jgi:hypothetical protein
LIPAAFAANAKYVGPAPALPLERNYSVARFELG